MVHARIRLEPEIEKRLDQLAKKTGRTKTYYAKLAIKEFLEEREDYLLGIAVRERSEPRTTLTDVRKELGLER